MENQRGATLKADTNKVFRRDLLALRRYSPLQGAIESVPRNIVDDLCLLMHRCLNDVLNDNGNVFSENADIKYYTNFFDVIDRNFFINLQNAVRDLVKATLKNFKAAAEKIAIEMKEKSNKSQPQKKQSLNRNHGDDCDCNNCEDGRYERDRHPQNCPCYACD